MPKQGGASGQPGIDDIMVKDPFCKVYFPQRQGIRATIHGVEYYFCSKECRDKFIEQNRAQDL
jgi:YHS domain-containing protein